MKTPAQNIPQNNQQAEALLLQLASVRNQLNVLETDRQKAVEKIQLRTQGDLEKLQHTETTLADRLASFANANRDKLTQNGKTKTVKLTNGEFVWRTSPSSLEVPKDKGALDETISQIQSLNRDECLTFKTSLNRNVLKSDPGLVAQLPHLTILEPLETIIIKTKEL